MALLEEQIEEQGSRLQRRAITVVAAILLLAGGLWWVLRFHTEKVTVRHFLDDVVAGRMDEAYRLWQPSSSYAMSDFLDDWGPKGYYGPVKSYRVKDASHAKGSTVEVIITAEVSPYSPFPAGGDAFEQSKTKEVRIWVLHTNQSMSFPP